MGGILYNDVRTPLAMQGAEFRLALNAGGDASKPIYVGALDWKDVQFAAMRYVPVPINLLAKFTIRRDGFAVEQALVGAGRSKVDLQAELSNYASQAGNSNIGLGWTYRIFGRHCDRR